MLARWLGSAGRLPALHFLALGGLLAIADARLTGAPAGGGRAPILITATRVDEIREDYARTLQTVPSAADVAALVAREADEEMLYREALLIGLDRRDRAVKWRIVEKMHFLFGDDGGDADAAYRRGLELGLDRDDVVVRNAMVTKMRLLAKQASRTEEPTGPALEAALAAYLANHADTFSQSARISLTQIYLSAEKRGDALAADAAALLARLRADATPPSAATRLGDPFPAGAAVRDASSTTMAKLFGDGLASAVAKLPAGQWSDPIPSPYGLHLVWVSGRTAADLPPLADVRERVLRAYRAERRDAYLARMMVELRGAYRVEVEHAG
jgi:hypothetical protein